jgi:transcription initiation factor TFIIIB Brf1 subunit/transcription initiation factor TFIIB
VLPREDFVFTIGYDGPAAVVDNQAKKKYGKLSTRELAEKGLFRAAYTSALFSKNEDELKFVLETYKRLGAESGADLSSPERLFGVFLVDVKRSISL